MIIIYHCDLINLLSGTLSTPRNKLFIILCYVGGLNENNSHGPIHLNSWSPADKNVWEGLG